MSMEKKRTFVLLLTALLCLFSTTAMAAGALLLPDSLRIVKDEAFYGAQNIDTVVLPQNVEEIGNRAFADSTLRAINLPESIMYIAEDAFSGCGKISVTAPVGSYAYTWAIEAGLIESDGFVYRILDDYSCAVEGYFGEETDLVLPSNAPDGRVICEIADGAFRGMTQLTSVTLSEGLLRIGEYAFENCTRLQGYLYLPETLMYIGKAAFRGCSALTGELYIPASTEYLGEEAFAYCSGLGSTLTIANSKTVIEENVFLGCDGLTEMSQFTFADLEDGSCEVSRYSGYLWNIEIPMYSPAGKRVTRIAENAFKRCGNSGSLLQPVETFSVIVPEGVTSIGRMAFYQSGLSGITLPQTLLSVDQYAFSDCDYLYEVELPDSLTNLGAYAFEKCSSLSRVKLSASMTSIPYAAFNQCFSISSVFIPEGVMQIMAYSLNCKLSEIVIPASVTSIDSGAFMYNPQRIYGERGTAAETYAGSNGIRFIRTGWAYVNDFVFEESYDGSGELIITDYLGNAQEVVIPAMFTDGRKVVAIGTDVFCDHANMTGVEIPYGIRDVYNRAFMNCSSLQSVILPDSVEWIFDEAFRGCSGMQEISMSKKLKQIYGYAFYGCSGLKRVELFDGCIQILNSSFADCESLQSIVIPKSVSYIEYDAFTFCEGLKIYAESGSAAHDFAEENDIPCISEDVLKDGNYVYAALSSTTAAIVDYLGSGETATLPNAAPDGRSVIAVGERAFARTELSAVKIPRGIKHIGASAFYGCMKLETVSLGDSVASFGAFAFADCRSLSGISLPVSLNSIGASAFSRCSALTSVQLPAKLETLGNAAFYYCTGLTSVKIPGSLERIGQSVFENCSSLSSVEIKQGVLEIGDYAFYDTANPLDIVIPPSVETIPLLSLGGSYRKRIVNVYGQEGSAAEEYIYKPQLSFEKNFYSIAERYPTYTADISISILDSEGNPVGNAIVTLYDGSDNQIAQTRTDDAGTCLFMDVDAAAVYSVVAEKKDHVINGGEWISLTPDETETVQMSAEMVLQTEMFVISPQDGAQYDGEEITVSFNRVYNAEKYIYSLRDLTDTPLNQDGNLLVERAEINENGLELVGLNGGHRYRLAVGAILNDQTEKWRSVEFYMRSAEEPAVTGFDMPMEYVYTGTPVTFTIYAEHAQSVTLYVDGIEYESAEVVDGIAVLERAFSKGGLRNVAFSANYENKPSSMSETKSLLVMADGLLDRPQIELSGDTYVGADVSLRWAPVPNAEEYVIYLGYDGSATRIARIQAQDTAQMEYTISASAMTQAGDYGVEVIATAPGYDQRSGIAGFKLVEFESYTAWLQDSTAILYSDASMTQAVARIDGAQAITVLYEADSAACVQADNGGNTVKGWLSASLIGKTQWAKESRMRCWYLRRNPQDADCAVTATVWATDDIAVVRIPAENLVDVREDGIPVSSEPGMLKYIFTLPAVKETTVFEIIGYDSENLAVKTINLVVPPVAVEDELVLAKPVIHDCAPITLGNKATIYWTQSSKATAYTISLWRDSAEVMNPIVVQASANMADMSAVIPATALSAAGEYLLTISASAEGCTSSSTSAILTVKDDAEYLYLQQAKWSESGAASTITFRDLLRVDRETLDTYTVTWTNRMGNTCLATIPKDLLGSRKYIPDDAPAFGNELKPDSFKGARWAGQMVELSITANLVTDRAEIWSDGEKYADMTLSGEFGLVNQTRFSASWEMQEGEQIVTVRLIAANGATEEQSVTLTGTAYHEHTMDMSIAEVERKITDRGMKVINGKCQGCGVNLSGIYVSPHLVYGRVINIGSSVIRISGRIDDPLLEIALTEHDLHIQSGAVLNVNRVSVSGQIDVAGEVNTESISCKDILISGSLHGKQISSDVISVGTTGRFIMSAGDNVSVGDFVFASSTDHRALLTGGKLTISRDMAVGYGGFKAAKEHETIFSARVHNLVAKSVNVEFGTLVIHGIATNLHASRHFDYHYLVIPRIESNPVQEYTAPAVPESLKPYQAAMHTGSGYSSASSFASSVEREIRKKKYAEQKDVKFTADAANLKLINEFGFFNVAYTMDIGTFEGSKRAAIIQLVGLNALTEGSTQKGMGLNSLLAKMLSTGDVYYYDAGTYETVYENEVVRVKYNASVTGIYAGNAGGKAAWLQVEYTEWIDGGDGKRYTTELNLLTDNNATIENIMNNMKWNGKETVDQIVEQAKQDVLEDYISFVAGVTEVDALNKGVAIYNSLGTVVNTDESELSTIPLFSVYTEDGTWEIMTGHGNSEPFVDLANGLYSTDKVGTPFAYEMLDTWW